MWLFGLEQFFAASGLHADAARIAFAAASLDRTALQWWHLISVVAARPGGAAVPTTWSQFSAALIARFQAINVERAARDRLHDLRQTGGVAAYAAAFQQVLLRVPDLTDAAAKHQFIHGLKPTVQRELLFRDPASLTDALAMAERVDSVVYRTQPPPGPRRPAAAGADGGPTAMDLGQLEDYAEAQEEWTDDAEPEEEVAAVGPARPAGRGPPPAGRGPPSAARAPYLDPEERRRCLESQLCFKCKRPGHRSGQCPASRPNSAHPNGRRPLQAGAAGPRA